MGRRYVLTPEDRQIIAEQLGETFAVGDQYVDLVLVATLLGVAKDTPTKWRSRVSSGFPPADDTRYRTKPQWRLSTIVKWARSPEMLRWPPGTASQLQIPQRQRQEPYVARPVTA
jgi:hypothetical protein